jgi:hypothetical protein
MAKKLTVDRDTVIQALIKNPALPFNADDADWLAKGDDDRLIQMLAFAGSNTPDSYSPARDKAPKQTLATEDKNYQAHGAPADGYRLNIKNQTRRGSK